MTFADLIAALERAEGPSAELDNAIDALTRPKSPELVIEYRVGWSGEVGEMRWSTDAGWSGWFAVPEYTASIDAALALVPEGWSWRVGNLPSGRSFADLGTQRSLQCIEGATPALALSLASLRARSAQNGGANG